MNPVFMSKIVIFIFVFLKIIKKCKLICAEDLSTKIYKSHFDLGNRYK